MSKTQEQEFSEAFNGVQDNQEGAEPATTNEGAEPAVAVMISEPEKAVQAAAESAPAEAAQVVQESAAPVAEGQAGQDGEGDGTEAMTPQEIQQEKSWAGRLKKREEELAAREAALAEREASLSAPAGNADLGTMTAGEEPHLAEGGEVEGGETSEPAGGDLNAIIERLREDFGDEFISAIQAIAAAKAEEVAGGGVSSQLEELKGVIAQLESGVHDAFSEMHREAITSEYPDVEEIAERKEFQEFCANHSDPERCKQIMEDGSTRQVLGLLKEYKSYLDSQGGEAHPDEDAAAGVQGSAPVKLPTKAPASDEDEYKAAWSQM